MCEGYGMQNSIAFYNLKTFQNITLKVIRILHRYYFRIYCISFFSMQHHYVILLCMSFNIMNYNCTYVVWI